MSRPIQATVNQRILTQNLNRVRHYAPASKVWSVVKANAYGHGLARCHTALASTDGFALLNIEEAILLRDAGVTKPILLLEGFFSPEDLRLIEHYHLTTAVHSDWQLQALENYISHTPIPIYIKVNTGMNRLGFSPVEVNNVWQKLHGLSAVGEMTIMTHFAQADEGADYIRQPMQRLKQAVGSLSCELSCANSAATLWHPSTHHQWVRPGIILYGASPSGKSSDIAGTGLEPVMSLHSKIIAIQTVAGGEGIGYGQRYRSTQGQRIGIVACGYADGYPRHAPTGTPVIVEGQRVQTVGTVSMDMLMVDLTDCPKATLGSRVELWGAQLAVDEVANAAGTLGYELLTAVTQRVPFIVD